MVFHLMPTPLSMRMRDLALPKGKIFLPLLLGLLVSSVWADETKTNTSDDINTKGIRLSGYGTLGYATDNQELIAPIRDFSQRLKDGYLTEDSWRLDSRLGVQFDYRFSPKTEVVAQVLLRDQVINNLKTATELAYLGITPSTEWDLRIGRVGYDVFLSSDHRSLGYSYAWIRPPEVYYSWIPVFSVDGVDAVFKIDTEDAHWRIKGQLGRSRPAFAIGLGGYQADIDEIYALSAARESGPWRIKASFSYLKAGNEVPAFAPLHSHLDRIANSASAAAVRQEASQLRTEFSTLGASKDFLSLGVAYDDGVWQGQAEVGVTHTNRDFFSASEAAFLTLGRRMGNVTPFFILSVVQPTSHLHQPINDWQHEAPIQEKSIEVINSSRLDQKTLSLGMRWDVCDQAALKLQWSTTHINEQGYGLWWRPVVFNSQDKRVNALAVSLDFIF
jgi:hypothetical protein